MFYAEHWSGDAPVESMKENDYCYSANNSSVPEGIENLSLTLVD